MKEHVSKYVCWGYGTYKFHFEISIVNISGAEFNLLLQKWNLTCCNLFLKAAVTINYRLSPRKSLKSTVTYWNYETIICLSRVLYGQGRVCDFLKLSWKSTFLNDQIERRISFLMIDILYVLRKLFCSTWNCRKCILLLITLHLHSYIKL